MGAIAIQRHDDIAGCVSKSLFVGSAITAIQFRNDNRAHLTCNGGRSVGGVVIHDNDFVDKVRKVVQDLLYSVLFVETRNDDGDSAAFVHSGR